MDRTRSENCLYFRKGNHLYILSTTTVIKSISTPYLAFE